MNGEDIARRTADIRAAAGDDETAHGMEDRLHQDVLRAIADGTAVGDVKLLAGYALRTLDIDFSRWCA